MAGRGADEGRRKPPGSGRARCPPSAPGSTAPGTEKPPWSAERRTRSRQRSAARRKTGAPLGAPSPRHFVGGRLPRTPCRGARERKTAYPAPIKNTGDGARADEKFAVLPAPASAGVNSSGHPVHIDSAVITGSPLSRGRQSGALPRNDERESCPTSASSTARSPPPSCCC